MNEDNLHNSCWIIYIIHVECRVCLLTERNVWSCVFTIQGCVLSAVYIQCIHTMQYKAMRCNEDLQIIMTVNKKCGWWRSLNLDPDQRIEPLTIWLRYLLNIVFQQLSFKKLEPIPRIKTVSLNKCVCKTWHWCICSYEKCSVGGSLFPPSRAVKSGERGLHKTFPAASSCSSHCSV